MKGKIESFQLFVIGHMMGTALFVGMGNIDTVLIAKENSWIIALLGAIVGVIPVLLISKLYKVLPSLNIFEKIDKLFGKIFGKLINLTIALIVLFVMLLSLFAISNFACTKYLTETPLMFVAFLFMLPIAYASKKGLEVILRTVQMLFYMYIIMHITITSSLTQYVDISNLKPYLNISSNDFIRSLLNFISYCFIPMITLLIIPKNNITNPKKITKALVLGYVLSSGIMLVVFFMNMTVVGYSIASLYRYPEYFIMKKVSVTTAFDNIENFFSLCWMFNLFACASMTFYYIKEYINHTFNIKKDKTKDKLLIALAIASVIFVAMYFKDITKINIFMMTKFPYVTFIPILIIILLILVKSKLSKKT